MVLEAVGGYQLTKGAGVMETQKGTRELSLGGPVREEEEIEL